MMCIIGGNIVILFPADTCLISRKLLCTDSGFAYRVLFPFVGSPHQFGTQCLGKTVVVTFDDFDAERSFL